MRSITAGKRDQLNLTDNELEDAVNRLATILESSGLEFHAQKSRRTIRKHLWDAVKESDRNNAARTVIDLCFPPTTGILGSACQYASRPRIEDHSELPQRQASSIQRTGSYPPAYTDLSTQNQTRIGYSGELPDDNTRMDNYEISGIEYVISAGKNASAILSEKLGAIFGENIVQGIEDTFRSVIEAWRKNPDNDSTLKSLSFPWEYLPTDFVGDAYSIFSENGIRLEVNVLRGARWMRLLPVSSAAQAANIHQSIRNAQINMRFHSPAETEVHKIIDWQSRLAIERFCTYVNYMNAHWTPVISRSVFATAVRGECSEYPEYSVAIENVMIHLYGLTDEKRRVQGSAPRGLLFLGPDTRQDDMDREQFVRTIFRVLDIHIAHISHSDDDAFEDVDLVSQMLQSRNSALNLIAELSLR